MLAMAFALNLCACTPKYDWREVRGSDAPYTVVLPAKPATYAREVNLDGLRVTMSMTAAEIDGVMFAVGSAELPDAAQAPAVLQAMKTALVRNIGGTLRREKSAVATQSSGDSASAAMSIDIEAVGPPAPRTDGQPRMLFARFIAKNRRVYQTVVIGPERAVTREAVDTFFTSFKVE